MRNSLLDKAATTVLNLAHRQWEEEEASDFSTLRGIPSTTVRRFLLYYDSLKPDDRILWTNIRLKRVPFLFLPNWIAEYSQDEEQCLKQHADRIVSCFWGWRTLGLRELKLAISMAESGHDRINIDWIPRDAIEWVKNARAARAGFLRRIIKPALKREFGLAAEKQGGGEWKYKRSDETGSLIVTLDFGGMCSQLRYDVQVENKTRSVKAERLTFEGILGVTCLGWDWITEENAKECVFLLTDLLKRVNDFTTVVGNAIGEERTAEPGDPNSL